MCRPAGERSVVWHIGTRHAAAGEVLAGIFAVSFSTTPHGEPVLVKSQFGDTGCSVHLPPAEQRRVIGALQSAGFVPELVETCTLYRGSRSTPAEHLATAASHGFTPSTMGCLLRILGGEGGDDALPVRLDDPPAREVFLPSDLPAGRALVVLSAFKGHSIFGFSGALKNAGMGLAARRGKLAIHSATPPVVAPEECSRCGRCADVCAHGAIDAAHELPRWDASACVGCGLCIHRCPERAIRVSWQDTPMDALELLVDYAAAVHRRAEGRVVYVNSLERVHHACEDHVGAERPVCTGLGWLVSEDPVALDAASLSMFESTPTLEPTWGKRLPAGRRIASLYPDVQTDRLFFWAERRGLGTTAFDLREILEPIRTKAAMETVP